MWRVSQGGACFFTLATPKSVFTVFSSPGSAGTEHAAAVAVGPGERFSFSSSGSSLAWWSEEEMRLFCAKRVSSPSLPFGDSDELIKHVHSLPSNLALNSARTYRT